MKMFIYRWAGAFDHFRENIISFAKYRTIIFFSSVYSVYIIGVYIFLLFQVILRGPSLWRAKDNIKSNLINLTTYTGLLCETSFCWCKTIPNRNSNYYQNENYENLHIFATSVVNNTQFIKIALTQVRRKLSYTIDYFFSILKKKTIPERFNAHIFHSFLLEHMSRWWIDKV